VVVGAVAGAVRDETLKILITGAAGQLGTDLARLAAEESHHEVVGADHHRLDVGDRDAVLSMLTSVRPDLVVHAAAWTAVDDCESDPDRAWKVNALACRHVAEGTRAVGGHLVAVSTDYVFDGTSPDPYTEWDKPNPQSVYGHSKLGGETEIRGALPGAAIVRTSWVCGPHGTNMVKTVLRLAAQGRPLRFVDDQRGCPTFTGDLAGMILRLGWGRLPGLFHVTNQGATTWFQFARDVVTAAGGDPAMIEPIGTSELSPARPAPRPANSVLDNAALRLSGIPLLADHHEPLERTVKALVG
jgi:dTDP-4-dehydrorhamnose reductase